MFAVVGLHIFKFSKHHSKINPMVVRLFAKLLKPHEASDSDFDPKGGKADHSQQLHIAGSRLYHSFLVPNTGASPKERPYTLTDLTLHFLVVRVHKYERYHRRQQQLND